MKMRIPFVLLALSVFFGLSSAVVLAADMFSGTWKLNIAKSTYGSGQPPREPTVSKYQAIENGFSLVSDGVSSSGKPAHSKYSFHFDGKDYPGTQTLDGKPNATDQTISAKKIDDYTIEFTFKNKGSVVAHAKAVVSKDGKTETYTLTSTFSDGQQFTNTTIWEKQ